ncbi:MAG: hypothetical protein JNM76_01280 [Betaproteobacteria bacterium]|nr:hypothetical protein [Betaproteobacteria bacterium]
MRGPSCVASLVVAVALGGCASLPAPAPGVVSARIEVATAQGVAKAIRFAPAGGQPLRGVVVFIHGFLRAPARHADFAARLAREGHVVVLPDLDSPFADGARGRDGAHALALLREVSRPPDAARLPLIVGGFSRGAGIALDLAANLDAAERERLAGVVLLDPVTGAIPQSLRDPAPPVALVTAPAAACNALGRSFAPLRAALRPAVDVEIEGATHCDPESPSDVVCAVYCGAPDPARQARFTDALVAFVLSRTEAPVAQAPR